MTINYFYKLPKSVLLCMALISSGMVLLVPTAQAVNISVQNFRGTWNAAANYRAGDVVGYQSQSYIAQQANHGQRPVPASPVWYLLAAQGPQGATGGTGPKGDTGETGPAGPKGEPGKDGTNGSFPAGTASGDMLWWNGTAWVMIPAGFHNTTLKNCNGVPTWVVAHCGGFVLGDIGPAGGFVFYLTDNTGQHGLEAAPVDQSAAAPWGCNATRITGATGTAIGTGAANTAAIVAGCAEVGIAAKVTDNYSLNGYDDWYLPSKDELDELYKARDIVGGFTKDYYWSSSESDLLFAWSQNFNIVEQQPLYKGNAYRVRAVRAF